MTDSLDPINADGEEIPVKLPSGSDFPVLNDSEKTYVESTTNNYVSQLALTNVSDLADLDRVIMMELLLWRWGNWLSMGRDYWGDPVNESQLRKDIKEWAGEVRQLKKLLGIDKATREKEKGENFNEYLEKLKQRAKAFGIKREKELTVALTLFHELKSKIEFYGNATDEERKQFGSEPEDIVAWIRDEAIPQFNAVDEYFRDKEQKFWIKDQ